MPLQETLGAWTLLLSLFPSHHEMNRPPSLMLFSLATVPKWWGQEPCAETAETVSQKKAFLLVRRLHQGFCYHFTNTGNDISLTFLSLIPEIKNDTGYILEQLALSNETSKAGSQKCALPCQGTLPSWALEVSGESPGFYVWLSILSFTDVCCRAQTQDEQVVHIGPWVNSLFIAQYP
jgi:hypothetical protein